MLVLGSFSPPLDDNRKILGNPSPPPPMCMSVCLFEQGGWFPNGVWGWGYFGGDGSIRHDCKWLPTFGRHRPLTSGSVLSITLQYTELRTTKIWFEVDQVQVGRVLVVLRCSTKL
jgi:hypothetical protein